MHKDVLRAIPIVVCVLLFGALLVHTIRGTAAQPAQDTLIDTKDGVILFIVDGKEVLTIDADGLHVRGDIQYTGITIDTNGGPDDAP